MADRRGVTSRHENTEFRVMVLDDGFGNEWMLCDREPCDLEIVRPGKVRCWCDGNGNPQ